jgi:hypothetical protein
MEAPIELFVSTAVLVPRCTRQEFDQIAAALAEATAAGIAKPCVAYEDREARDDAHEGCMLLYIDSPIDSVMAQWRAGWCQGYLAALRRTQAHIDS